MKRLRTVVAVLAMLALLAACARTTVVRTPPREAVIAGGRLLVG